MLAALLNCSYRFNGRKVSTLYLYVFMALPWRHEDESARYTTNQHPAEPRGLNQRQLDFFGLNGGRSSTDEANEDTNDPLEGGEGEWLAVREFSLQKSRPLNQRCPTLDLQGHRPCFRPAVLDPGPGQLHRRGFSCFPALHEVFKSCRSLVVTPLFN